MKFDLSIITWYRYQLEYLILNYLIHDYTEVLIKKKLYNIIGIVTIV